MCREAGNHAWQTPEPGHHTAIFYGRSLTQTESLTHRAPFNSKGRNK